MLLINKLLNVNLIRPTVKAEIIKARGSIKEEFPSDFSASEMALIRSVAGLTMTSHERLASLIRALEYLTAKGVIGDIVECGVWRGGSMALAARKLIDLKQQHRKLFLFDTFEGMTPPTKFDKSSIDDTSAEWQLEKSDKFTETNVWCYSTLENVKNNLAATKYPPQNIIYRKGRVEETLPEKTIEKIALLRLDTDWYESTKHELETLYDLIVPGGVLIIDDYGHWSGARKAVDEFFENRNIIPYLHRVDYTCRLFIKN